MRPAEVTRHCELDAESRRMLEDAHRKLGLSARGWDRCVRLARTIADLDGEAGIAPDHVTEAIERRRRPDT
jgi:magnesium chelatase family protein